MAAAAMHDPAHIDLAGRSTSGIDLPASTFSQGRASGASATSRQQITRPADLLDTAVGIAAVLVGGTDAGGRITEMLGNTIDDDRFEIMRRDSPGRPLLGDVRFMGDIIAVAPWALVGGPGYLTDRFRGQYAGMTGLSLARIADRSPDSPGS